MKKKEPNYPILTARTPDPKAAMETIQDLLREHKQFAVSYDSSEIIISYTTGPGSE